MALAAAPNFTVSKPYFVSRYSRLDSTDAKGEKRQSTENTSPTAFLQSVSTAKDCLASCEADLSSEPVGADQKEEATDWLE